MSEGALGLRDGLAWPVADVLPGARERVEDAGLAGVGVASESQGEGAAHAALAASADASCASTRMLDRTGRVVLVGTLAATATRPS